MRKEILYDGGNEDNIYYKLAGNPIHAFSIMKRLYYDLEHVKHSLEHTMQDETNGREFNIF